MSHQPSLFADNKIIEPKIGITYKGSKRKIAGKLLQVMRDNCPQATHFYDLFGGGGSMSFCALANGYSVVYNDLNKRSFYCFDFVTTQQLTSEYLRFISRDEFHKLRAEEPNYYNSIMTLVYSFGSDCRTYFCNPEKEKFKRMGHELVVDNKLESAEFFDSYFEDLGGVGGVCKHLQNSVFPSIDWTERRKYFINVVHKLEVIAVAKLGRKFKYGDYEAIYKMKQSDICKMVEKSGGLSDMHRLDLGKVKNLEQLGRLQNLRFLQPLNAISSLTTQQQITQQEKSYNLLQKMSLDYRDVPITTTPDETILYFDPPYIGTSGYSLNGTHTSKGFDHQEFYSYCIDLAKQGFKVFISEYTMPADRFQCILEIDTISTMGAASNSTKRVEKLFTPISK